MKSDIEIVQETMAQPIKEVAVTHRIREDDLELYSRCKAELTDELRGQVKGRPNERPVLIAAINPTPAGGGKAATTVGLGETFGKMGKKAIIALRELSLDPCFGVKGGTAGDGYAQVVPIEDLNLHFIDDFRTTISTNNLLATLLDNHIQQGNALRIDPRQIQWKRYVDTSNRVLRNIAVGLGAKGDGTVGEDHFVVIMVSEIMAILYLADDVEDLKNRLGKTIVTYNLVGKPVTAEQLRAVGSMTALLKEALRPNLIQTLEYTGTPVRGDPPINIARGRNSVRATKAALKLANVVITETGFGTDLGAEKLLDIKYRKVGLKPDIVVLVATARVLKYNGGVPRDQLPAENLEALEKGTINLEKRIGDLRKFGMPMVVTLNSFISGTEAEYAHIKKFYEDKGRELALSEVWVKGGEGGIALAEKVMKTLGNEPTQYHVLCPDEMSLKDGINTIAREIYGISGTSFASAAVKALEHIKGMDFGGLPVCMARARYSLSDDQTKLGRPAGFTISIRDVYVSAGTDFVVVLIGSIMTMPGLPKKPAADSIGVDEDDKTTGLFWEMGLARRVRKRNARSGYILA